jgi:hypothetical protein
MVAPWFRVSRIVVDHVDLVEPFAARTARADSGTMVVKPRN